MTETALASLWRRHALPAARTRFVASAHERLAQCYAWQERSAILEHDAGLAAADAERRATEELGYVPADEDLARLRAWLLAGSRLRKREPETAPCGNR